MAISPKPLYCWQQAPLVAEVGSEEVAYDPEVYALRAHLKHAGQELDILKSLGRQTQCSAKHEPARQLLRQRNR